MSTEARVAAFRSEMAAVPALNMPFTKGSFIDIFSRIGAIYQVAVNYLERLIGSSIVLDDGEVEAVIRETERIYDTYIGPIDIPWVPNLIEPLIDANIRSSIRPNLLAAVKYFRDKVKAPNMPTPTVTPPVVANPPGSVE